MKLKDMENEMEVENNKESPKMDNIENEKIKNILNCVANSDGFFKSQQRGEEDLNFNQKKEIAKEILEKNIPLFLRRYGKYIHYEDLEYFEPYRTDYEVNFYVMEIEKMHSGKRKSVKVKNRRYEALQRLIKQGTYFSESEMRKRNPVLYEQMVGRFLTDEERKQTEKFDENIKFSTLLLEHLDRSDGCSVRRQEQEFECAQWEEESESDDELDCEEKSKINEEDKQFFRNEFVSVMYERFLSGKDKDFDYNNVDDNADYDDITICDMDEEEKYFDSEEPEQLNS
ncbi:coiled-coil domain-containing protein 97-like [Centruroides sculpturatus]|uniref:coiled-coil domain-containing protein 97-like n=1 Tax=Centruroides sculpturatus TaxID=218467 RepID=UPI000C6D3228|nr:coiled-coil domain-containing protein 97-like [Centruroides sculpturatus]